MDLVASGVIKKEELASAFTQTDKSPLILQKITSSRRGCQGIFLPVPCCPARGGESARGTVWDTGIKPLKW